MENETPQNDPAPPEPRKLAFATLASVTAAALILIVAVLPAEYGIDPTGIGTAMGFSRLSDDGTNPQDTVDEGGPRILHSINAYWEVAEHPVTSREGYSDGPFDTTRISLPLAITNLTKVTAHLEWWDNDTIDGQRTDPDRFELSIHAPDRRSTPRVFDDNGPDGHGNLSVSLPWRSLPVPEKNTTENRLSLPVTEADESSHGDWSIEVRLLQARGLPGHEDGDPGNAWRLTVTAETYELIVDEQESLGGDRVQLRLRPNQGLEYKFHMQEGARLDYRWSSSAPLYWDLHAEEDGQGHDDFTRFQDGTSSGDQGSITAPFSGNHGWYWHNSGTEPITLTLETRGDYRIIGIPS